MWEYWWLMLIAGCCALGAGAMIWLNTASAMTRVVTPSADWLKREARLNMLSPRLMTIGTVLAVVGVALAIGHWMSA